jgi:hypothetical protein
MNVLPLGKDVGCKASSKFSQVKYYVTTLGHLGCNFGDQDQV